MDRRKCACASPTIGNGDAGVCQLIWTDSIWGFTLVSLCHLLLPLCHRLRRLCGASYFSSFILTVTCVVASVNSQLLHLCHSLNGPTSTASDYACTAPQARWFIVKENETKTRTSQTFGLLGTTARIRPPRAFKHIPWPRQTIGVPVRCRAITKLQKLFEHLVCLVR